MYMHAYIDLFTSTTYTFLVFRQTHLLFNISQVIKSTKDKEFYQSGMLATSMSSVWGPYIYSIGAKGDAITQECGNKAISLTLMSSAEALLQWCCPLGASASVFSILLKLRGRCGFELSDIFAVEQVFGISSVNVDTYKLLYFNRMTTPKWICG